MGTLTQGGLALAGGARCGYVYRISYGYTSAEMRTNIEIDDDLIREALRISGLRTKRAAVEAGLKALIRLNRQKKILDLAGKVHWEGNLDESRESRFPP
jgi:Arc/MetJ family transcription regulator